MMNNLKTYAAKIKTWPLYAIIIFLLLPVSCTPYKVDIPEIFAAQKEGGKTVFYSPDGFKASIKNEKNRPEKNTAFWAEALKTQLEGEGYLIVSEKPFTSDNLEWVSFTWLLPKGQSYYKYMTALSVRGKKIFIMEAAGEKDIFDSYEKDVENIITSIIAK